MEYWVTFAGILAAIFTCGGMVMYNLAKFGYLSSRWAYRGKHRGVYLHPRVSDVGHVHIGVIPQFLPFMEELRNDMVQIRVRVPEYSWPENDSPREIRGTTRGVPWATQFD